MSVRARFFVQQVTKQAADTGSVRLQAVSRGPENKEWAAYTPSGSLEMSLSRKAGPALDWFEEHLGHEVFLDISEASEPVEPTA
jgi:hypothetical protein